MKMLLYYFVEILKIQFSYLCVEDLNHNEVYQPISEKSGSISSRFYFTSTETISSLSRQINAESDSDLTGILVLMSELGCPTYVSNKTILPIFDIFYIFLSDCLVLYYI